MQNGFSYIKELETLEIPCFAMAFGKLADTFEGYRMVLSTLLF